MTIDTIILHASMIACWLALSVWSVVRALRGHRPCWLLFATGFLFAAAHRCIILLSIAGFVGWSRWEVLALPIGTLTCMVLGMWGTRGEKWCRSCPFLIEQEYRDFMESQK